MTQTTFISSPDFLAFVAAHKQRAHLKSLTATDLLAYNLVRDLDPRRGFTPITNTNKLTHGARPAFGFEEAVRSFKFKTNPRVIAEHAKRYGITQEYMMELGNKLRELT